MAFTNNQLDNIPNVLSQPRFATYLQKCDGDRNKAMELYQWNLEISSAFIIPLHLFEVSIRNAVVECLENVHTSNWPWNKGFIHRLPDPRIGYSPTRNLQKVSSMKNPTMGKVVAELKFVFWEKMFTKRHDYRLWDTHIKTAFPNAPSTLTTAEIRKKIHDDINIIRMLRNRIAHHEPIFNRDLQEDYDRIHQLILWRDKETANWINSLQSVTALL